MNSLQHCTTTHYIVVQFLSGNALSSFNRNAMNNDGNGNNDNDGNISSGNSASMNNDGNGTTALRVRRSYYLEER
jgi:hypothetical protein